MSVEQIQAWQSLIVVALIPLVTIIVGAANAWLSYKGRQALTTKTEAVAQRIEAKTDTQTAAITGVVLDNQAKIAAAVADTTGAPKDIVAAETAQACADQHRNGGTGVLLKGRDI